SCMTPLGPGDVTAVLQSHPLDTYAGSPVSLPFYEDRLGYQRRSITLHKDSDHLLSTNGTAAREAAGTQAPTTAGLHGRRRQAELPNRFWQRIRPYANCGAQIEPSAVRAFPVAS
ncbi:MAG TPA: hypothetical protein VMV92_27560, partial [Streptosporangiaceae bacterium]|nr:hypothetical protein [Streptosporangiaceae bacterium]